MNVKIIFAAAMLAAVSTTPVRAQVVLDMALVTCGQFMSETPEHQDLIASWMSGYLSASKNLAMIDFRYLERNYKAVGKYCKSNKAETLMSAIQKNAK